MGPVFTNKLDTCVGQKEKVHTGKKRMRPLNLCHTLFRPFKRYIKKGETMRVHGDVARTNGDLTGIVVLDERP